MSQQLALSSIFSVLALASLCFAAGNGHVGAVAVDSLIVVSQPYSAQADLTADLAG